MSVKILSYILCIAHKVQAVVRLDDFNGHSEYIVSGWHGGESGR
jgi:hypothetical protein